MEINIEITSTDKNDYSWEYSQYGDYLESMINEMNNSKELDVETKLDEERKLHGAPVSQERQILKNKTQ